MGRECRRGAHDLHGAVIRLCFTRALGLPRLLSLLRKARLAGGDRSRWRRFESVGGCIDGVRV